MTEDIDEYLGRRLRRRRRLLGLTQQQLAHACGVRFQQIQKYECAANRMSAGRLWQLAKVLDVPVSYFFEGFETAAPPADTLEPEPHRAAFASNDPQRLVSAYAIGERTQRPAVAPVKPLNAFKA
jgi:transcriptional regulator with XRE-family HTH domain